MSKSFDGTSLPIPLEDLNTILMVRILVARLGESPRFAWWGNSLDATDFEGGGSFFQKLLPKENMHIETISAY